MTPTDTVGVRALNEVWCIAHRSLWQSDEGECDFAGLQNDTPISFCRCTTPQPEPVGIGHVLIPRAYQCSMCRRGIR